MALLQCPDKAKSGCLLYCIAHSIVSPGNQHGQSARLLNQILQFWERCAGLGYDMGTVISALQETCEQRHRPRAFSIHDEDVKKARANSSEYSFGSEETAMMLTRNMMRYWVVQEVFGIL